ELHDGAIQGLFAIGLSLQGAAELLEEGTQVQRRLEDSVLQIDTVIRDLRKYVFQLRPDALSVHGLEEALRGIAAEFERETRVATRAELALQGDQPVLST